MDDILLVSEGIYSVALTLSGDEDDLEKLQAIDDLHFQLGSLLLDRLYHMEETIDGQHPF